MKRPRQPDAQDAERGALIASLRRSARISQSTLAEHLQVSTQQVGKYERGQNRMPMSRYIEALQFLKGDASNHGGFGFAEEAPAAYRAQSGLKDRLTASLTRLKREIAELDELVKEL